jgi:S1-C subfamily serine protease
MAIAFANDFCILTIVNPLKKKLNFLKIGNFNNIAEGEEVYTCGYPLGIKTQFISKGMLSTKDTMNAKRVTINQVNFQVKAENIGYLDITSNRGNSGGAVVKIGTSPDKDEVIGILDFGLNPLGSLADTIKAQLSSSVGSIQMGTIDQNGNMSQYTDPNRMAVIFADAISNLSIGVSGCISINYLSEALKVVTMAAHYK